MKHDRMGRDAALAAEVKPSAENAPFVRVLWCRRPWALAAGPLLVDVRLLHVSGTGAAAHTACGFVLDATGEPRP
jgi:hypothetical protein